MRLKKYQEVLLNLGNNFGGYLLLPPLRSLVFPFANTLTIIIWKCFPLLTAFHWFEGSSTGSAFVWSSWKWQNYVGKTSYLYRYVSVGRFWCIFNMSSRKGFCIKYHNHIGPPLTQWWPRWLLWLWSAKSPLQLDL